MECPTTPTRVVAPQPTPSKKVGTPPRRACVLGSLTSQAAAALEALTFDSPVKPSAKPAARLFDNELFDDAERSESPSTVGDAVEKVELTTEVKEDEDLRAQFIGEVDLPERE